MVDLEFFRRCVSVMKENGIDSALFDTRCIFEDFPDESHEKILEMVEKRCKGNPLQYILGEWDFWSYTFKVGEGVLIPRPDTEVIIENVIDICRKENIKSPKIVDLCSGSGCIAITLNKEIPQSVVYAVEKYDRAFEYLNDNIRLNNAEVKTLKADVLLESVADMFSDVDIIVSNPPYLTAEEMQDLQIEVKKEPHTALFGGDDGLDFYRRIIPLWRNSLKDGGCMVFEFGQGQHEKVGEILTRNNFFDIKFSRDTQNIIRTVTAHKQED